MVSVRRTGHREPVSGKGAVLRAIQEESQLMHQEGGANEAAVLRVVEEMEASGVPLVRPQGSMDVREEAEIQQGRREAEEEACGMEEAWRAWETRRAEEGAEDTLVDSLESGEYGELARELGKRMERILTDGALEAGMRRFREVP